MVTESLYDITIYRCWNQLPWLLNLSVILQMLVSVVMVTESLYDISDVGMGYHGY